MSFKREGAIFTLSGKPLKLVYKFTYFGSNISSIESDVNIRLAKAWTDIDWLSIIWKSDRSDRIKQDFFQAVTVSILLYGCTTWMLTKRIKKILHKKATSYFEQILEAWSHKATAVRPLTSHLKIHPNKMKKTCGTPLEKQGRTHKWRPSMDPYIWTCQCWPTSKNLSTLCGHRM